MSSLDSRAVESGRLGVRPFDGDEPAWDRFIGAQKNASFCHLAGWRGVMRDVMGAEPRYLIAYDESGAWHGVLPLVSVESRLFGRYLLSMPFLNHGGPLGSAEACGLLAQAAADAAEHLGADLMELRCRSRVAADLTVSHRKVTVTLALPEAADELWSQRFTPKLRSQIRRPGKDGMEARIGGRQVDEFYAVFARHMRDLGTPVLPYRWFERINVVFEDHVLFGTVRTASGEPAAAGCGFVWGDEFEMTWAASLGAHARSAPNMLLYWSFMEWLIERGLRIFNFGRCTPGGGTHRFKLQWGGEDEQLHWLQWSAAGVEATPSPEAPFYRLATAAWQRLPLPIANRLGPRLARKLP